MRRRRRVALVATLLLIVLAAAAVVALLLARAGTGRGQDGAPRTLAPVAPTYGEDCRDMSLDPQGDPSYATAATVRALRSGPHRCYDRVVVDLRGAADPAGFSVRYVDPGSLRDDRGRRVAVRGAGVLQVTIRAGAEDAGGRPTFRPPSAAEAIAVPTTYRVLRQVRWLGSSDGTTGLALGVREQVPFRMFAVRAGTSESLIVDIAHARQAGAGS